MRRRVDENGIIGLYESGVSMRQTAKEMGVAKNTVYSVLRRNGVAIRSRPGQRELDTGKIIALDRAGWKVKDIAWDVGASEQEVIDTLDHHRKEAGHA